MGVGAPGARVLPSYSIQPQALCVTHQGDWESAARGLWTNFNIELEATTGRDRLLL